MSLLASLLIAAAPLAAQTPAYTDKGELVLPANYRAWPFLGSGLGLTYGPAAPGPGESPRFDTVFVDPGSLARFQQTGHWPDGSTFVLEVRYSGSKGSINQGGYYPTDLAAVEVHVKDDKRFPDGSGFFGFGGGLEPVARTAPKLPVAAGCAACHNAHGAVDATFTQFYPDALAVAEAKGTLRPEYVAPAPSPVRFAHLLLDKGWEAARRTLADAGKSDPSASILQEMPMNQLAYGLLQRKHTANALRLFEWIAERFPRSANARDSLADALEAAGQPAAALAETEQALALAASDTSLRPERKARLLKSSEERRTRLQAQRH